MRSVTIKAPLEYGGKKYKSGDSLVIEEIYLAWLRACGVLDLDENLALEKQKRKIKGGDA